MSKQSDMIWIEDLGLGYCPAEPSVDLYDIEYWNEYLRRADSPMGRAITRARCDLVDRWVGRGDSVLDVGIGCGQFIESRGDNTYGFDVNPYGVKWLKSKKVFFSPYNYWSHSMTFWDVLEHIPNASEVIRNCQEFVFVTIPIFVSETNARNSRHFKPGEHIWYFTSPGLIRWFGGLGFKLVDENSMEVELGRVDVGTFVFQKI